MMRRSACIAILLSLFLLVGDPAEAQELSDNQDASLDVALQLQDVFAGVAEKVFSSVVSVSTFVRDEGRAKHPTFKPNDWQEGRLQDERYPGFKRLASGSGVLVGEDGYILTCRHILLRPDGELASVIDVETPDGCHTLSRVVGAEPTLNLAVLQLEVYSSRLPPKFAPATIGDPRQARVGHWALAAGDPFGPEKTFAAGLIARLPERQCYQGEITATYLHASLSIHREGYGGPLVNIRGEVLGITMPRGLPEISSGFGQEYALPIDIAMGIYEAMKVKKTFASPWLGFSVLELAALRLRIRDADVRAKIKSPRTGVYIDDVFNPSPASKAGIHVGDFLVRLEGQRILSVLGFQKALYLAGVGRTVTLEIFRKGRTIKKRLKVEARPEDAITR